MTSSGDYDGILLGAGHNSLILQAYPGRAGLKTLCLERRDTPGGGLATMEDPRHPGFLHNTHSFFHHLPNRRGGDLLVGALTPEQTGYNHPFPGAGHYRGHLAGLYLRGSRSHPGGNITGLPGYNCAQVLLSDLGRPAPWAPPPLEERLRAL